MLVRSPAVHLRSVSVLLMDLVEVSGGGAASGQAVHRWHTRRHSLKLAVIPFFGRPLLPVGCLHHKRRTGIKMYKKRKGFKNTHIHTHVHALVCVKK